MRVSLLALLLAVGSWSPAHADCALAWHSTIPLLMQGNLPTVPAEINDSVVGLLVDTGANVFTVTPQTARQLGLHPVKDYARGASVSGVGGGAYYEVDAVQTLRLGGVTYRNIAVLQSDIGSFAKYHEPVAGVIGSDLLSHYDLALDEPSETLGLYTAPAGCGRVAPPMPGGWRPVDLTLDDQDKLLVSVSVNGRPVRAMLDTGASGALMSDAVAARLGVTADGRSVRFGGVGVAVREAKLAHIAGLAIGGVSLRDVPVLVSPTVTGLPDGAEMLLGTALLGRVPVLISYRSRTLWLGGPAQK